MRFMRAGLFDHASVASSEGHATYPSGAIRAGVRHRGGCWLKAANNSPLRKLHLIVTTRLIVLPPRAKQADTGPVRKVVVIIQSILGNIALLSQAEVWMHSAGQAAVVV